jgi:hypothetical protein
MINKNEYILNWMKSKFKKVKYSKKIFLNLKFKKSTIIKTKKMLKKLMNKMNFQLLN